MSGCDVVTIGNPVVDVVTIGEPYCPQVKTFVDRLYELAVAQGYTPNGIGAHLPYIGTATTSLLVLCAEGDFPVAFNGMRSLQVYATTDRGNIIGNVNYLTDVYEGGEPYISTTPDVLAELVTMGNDEAFRDIFVC